MIPSIDISRLRRRVRGLTEAAINHELNKETYCDLRDHVIIRNKEWANVLGCMSFVAFCCSALLVVELKLVSVNRDTWYDDYPTPKPWNEACEFFLYFVVR